jgi:tetratricopeptide (TPR) repeat protein
MLHDHHASNTPAAGSKRFASAAALALAAALSVMPLAMVACQSHSPKIPGGSSVELRKALEIAAKGEQLRKDGHFNEAAEEYKKSIAIKNDLGAVWVNYGSCLWELGDFMPARDAYMRAADLLPTDPTPYENLGTLYHSRGWDEKALDYYKFSLEKDHNWLPSLRGAILATKQLRIADEASLARVENAIFIEKDPQLLRVMQVERFRIQAALKEEKTKH